jgi:hypothetical protein
MYERHDERIHSTHLRQRWIEHARWDRAILTFGVPLADFLIGHWASRVNPPSACTHAILRDIPNGALDNTIANYILALFHRRVELSPTAQRCATPFMIYDDMLESQVIHAGPFRISFWVSNAAEQFPSVGQIYFEDHSGSSRDPNRFYSGVLAPSHSVPMSHRSSADHSDWEGASDTS